MTKKKLFSPPEGVVVDEPFEPEEQAKPEPMDAAYRSPLEELFDERSQRDYDEEIIIVALRQLRQQLAAMKANKAVAQAGLMPEEAPGPRHPQQIEKEIVSLRARIELLRELHGRIGDTGLPEKTLETFATVPITGNDVLTEAVPIA